MIVIYYFSTRAVALFLVSKFLVIYLRKVRLCVQELHWHAQSARTATMIQQRIRRLIQIVWRQRSIADSAEHIHFTRRQNNHGRGKYTVYTASKELFI